MRVNFDEVSVKATYRWTNEHGKKRQCTKRFFQTINPFNRARDGLPKDRAQILDELQQERQEWLATARRILEAKAIAGQPLELSDADFAADAKAQQVREA